MAVVGEATWVVVDRMVVVVDGATVGATVDSGVLGGVDEVDVGEVITTTPVGVGRATELGHERA